MGNPASFHKRNSAQKAPLYSVQKQKQKLELELELLSPQSSERLARHARARIPNDVRVREADYFDGSRAPESQGQN